MTEQITAPAHRFPIWMFALTVVVISATNGAVWAIHGDGELAVRAYTTWTARIAFVLFILAFAASSLQALRPNKVTNRLVMQRRYVGLNFALAHFVHLGALIMVILITGVEPNLITIIFGGAAYVFILLMALTSNDWSLQKLGRGWVRLHTLGGYYIWGIFAYTFAGNIFQSSVSAMLLLIALAAMGLKIQAKTRPRIIAEDDLTPGDQA